MRRLFRMTLIGVLAALCSAGCSRSTDQQDTVSDATGAEVIKICVVNYPLKYFAERIGGDRVAVDFPAPPDVDPAFWKPAAEEISQIQEADLILLNGADYAKWISMASLSRFKIADTSSGFRERFIPLEETTTHSHGPGGEHVHGGTAFTTWLDPQLAIEQARAIADVFAARWPEHKEQFDAGFAGLEKDLLDLDAAIKKVMADEGDMPLVFSHPLYQYFERRYSLNGQSVHWEPDEMPTDEQWTELTGLLKSHEAKCMVWEGEPRQETATRLREMGIESVVFDPCGNVPEDGDFLTVMRLNLRNVQEAFAD